MLQVITAEQNPITEGNMIYQPEKCVNLNAGCKCTETFHTSHVCLDGWTSKSCCFLMDFQAENFCWCCRNTNSPQAVIISDSITVVIITGLKSVVKRDRKREHWERVEYLPSCTQSSVHSLWFKCVLSCSTVVVRLVVLRGYYRATHKSHGHSSSFRYCHGNRAEQDGDGCRRV